MTTSRLNMNRNEELGDAVFTADGALGVGEIRVIAMKALTRGELLILLRRAREALLERDVPRL